MEVTCHMGSHSVTCLPAAVTFPPLTQLKLVRSLVSPEGCKGELRWFIVHLPKTVSYLRNKRSVSWLWIEPTNASPRSWPLSHHFHNNIYCYAADDVIRVFTLVQWIEYQTRCQLILQKLCSVYEFYLHLPHALLEVLCLVGFKEVYPVYTWVFRCQPWNWNKK